MTASQRKPAPERPDRPEEVPLSLADTDAEGSTARLDGSAASASARSASSSSAASASSTEASGESGSSTGGFETMFGKLVVKRGLVTSEEVELANAMLTDAQTDGSPRTLADVLVDNDFITRRQLTRLKEEFESRKSSQQIPGYKIKAKLGAGAMATVFLGHQVSLDRKVAIKVLPQKFSQNEKFIERFYKEGRAAGQLNHPNIVAAYDVGQAGDHHYFVMEYVDGDTVYDRTKREKRVKEKDAIEMIRQTALALQHAHERGFVHRDIKPKNIMIDKRGVVKLADLGLARAVSDKEAAEAEAGRAYGTPYYISPEQIRGEKEIGPQADIYGLGATFYHMVTGKVPFEGKNPSEVMRRHLKEDLVPPDHVNKSLSTGCAMVIEMMMAKDRKDRYRNCADLIEDLELIAKGDPPHFAQRSFGFSGLNTELLEAAEAKAAASAQPVETQASATSSTAFMLMAVGLGLSVIVNLILIAVVAS